MSADPSASARPTAGAVSVVALEGIPEIRIGDDLPAIIVGAIEGTAGVLPLTEQDVLVVTQKIVSKAEGAIVDLTGVEPRPEAVEFAERWDRDARQVEVVLREARRVVRMDERRDHHRDAARVRVRQRRHRRLERRARIGLDRDAAARRSRRVRRPDPRGRPRRGSASTCP